MSTRTNGKLKGDPRENKFTRKATAAREFRSLTEDGFPFELPSGFVVLLKPADIGLLYQKGKIPQQLAPLLVEFYSTDKVDAAGMVARATEGMDGIIEVMEIVCCAALAEPRCIIPERDEKGEPIGICPDDAVWPEHLTLEDKQAIFLVANAPSEALRKFRLQQEKPVGAAADQ